MDRIYTDLGAESRYRAQDLDTQQKAINYLREELRKARSEIRRLSTKVTILEAEGGQGYCYKPLKPRLNPDSVRRTPMNPDLVL